MLRSSTACRIFNDCHSPSSNFSFAGADRLYWLGEPAPHTSLLNQLSIRLFWYVTQQASIPSYFSLLQAQQLRGIFTAFAMQAIRPSSHRCSQGNTILWRCFFFAALPESVLDRIPVNWGWIVAPFAWGSSPSPHPASSRSVSDSFSQHRIFLEILVSAVKGLYLPVQSVRRNTMIKSSYSGFALPN